MKKATYRIILSGDQQMDGPQQAKERLARLFKISPEKASEILSTERAILKTGLDAAKAKAMATAIQKAGFSCKIEKCAAPPKPFECPKCGYTCELDPNVTNGDICPSCQVVVQKFLESRNNETDPGTVETYRHEEEVQEESPREAESVLPVGFFKFAKWGITGFGALVFLFTGMTVFDMPSHEVMYALEAGPPICQGDPRLKHHPELSAYIAEYDIEAECIRSFKMTIANSGYRPQLQTVVRLKLPEAIESKMTGRPMFLDYDRAQRDVRYRKRGDVMSYALGPLKSMDQVTVRFKVILNRDEDIGWDDIFERVDIAEGDTLKGESPKLTMITRLLINLINIPGASLKEQAKNITDVFLSGAGDDGEDIGAEFDSASADLSVSIESAGIPRRYYDGITYRYSISIRVFNNGPGDAKNTRLAYSIPSDIEIKQQSLQVDNYQPKMYELLEETNRPRPADYSAPPPGCSWQGDEIVCNIEKIQPDSGATLHLRAEGDAKLIYYEASVESKQSDPDESDNDAVLEVLIPGEAEE